ncbi:MAG: YqaA family protein [Acidiferrobacterales bacterium]
MRLFSGLYDKVLGWSGHRYAPRYLAILSFAESSFFPVPPDVMLAPMVLAKPDKGWYFALLTSVASVLGGVAGYLIGLYAFDLIAPFMKELGYWDSYLTIKDWFDEWGFWAVFLAGFSPIPYKIFTIGAGAVALSFFPFLIASAIGRSARFFLVAAIIIFGGENMEHLLKKYIDIIGWTVVALIVGFGLFKLI